MFIINLNASFQQLELQGKMLLSRAPELKAKWQTRGTCTRTRVVYSLADTKTQVFLERAPNGHFEEYTSHFTDGGSVRQS